MKKLNVGIIFGGKSGEHNVSLLSSYNVIKGINKEKYDITMIGITLEGKWYIYNGDIEKIANNIWEDDKENLIEEFSLFGCPEINAIDIFFPVLHGQYGEDGTIQGLFEMLNKAYVGCGVLSSSSAMDKEIAKILFKNAGIPIVPYVMLNKTDTTDKKIFNQIMDKCEIELNYPMFIKPANMGSSVGISKAHNRIELENGLLKAVNFDTKVLIEKSINAREIEVAILGNDNPKATIPGEILPCNEFYDYEAKYLSGEDSRIEIPANITEKEKETIMTHAVKAFKAINGSGLSRVDFFIDKDTNNIYINEINTLPGFTNISMYSKLWDNCGISYSELIDRLIELGMEKYNNKKALMITEE